MFHRLDLGLPRLPSENLTSEWYLTLIKFLKFTYDTIKYKANVKGEPDMNAEISLIK